MYDSQTRNLREVEVILFGGEEQTSKARCEFSRAPVREVRPPGREGQEAAFRVTACGECVVWGGGRVIYHALCVSAVLLGASGTGCAAL